MSSHNGKVIERVIRRDKHSISDLARILNVNRRSIYNWFTHETLRPQTIYQVGHALRHDFSVEFPELFSSHDFIFDRKNSADRQSFAESLESEESQRWKNKYIELQQRHSKLLEQIFGIQKTG